MEARLRTLVRDRCPAKQIFERSEQVWDQSMSDFSANCFHVNYNRVGKTVTNSLVVL